MDAVWFWLVPVFYLTLGTLSFIFYARDKSAARNERRRTAEHTLHMLSLLGGWPGAWLAQRLLRHKSRKPSFQMVYWMTVALHCSVVVCLFSPYGRDVLKILRGWT